MRWGEAGKRGGDVVWHRDAEQVTLSRMPKYNGYMCGYGAHGGSKYDRNKEKRALEREIRDDS